MSDLKADPAPKAAPEPKRAQPKPKAKPLSQAELARQMKEMQELVARQRMLEKQIHEMGGDEGVNALSEVLSCIRGLSITFNENMRSMPGPERVIKEKFDALKASVNEARKSIDRIFEVDNVKKVIQMSDGYSPHLSSPEKAIRALISQSFDCMKEPSKDCIREVGEVLLDAVSNVVDAMSADWAEDYPELKKCLAEVSCDCIESWKVAGETLVSNFIEIEQNAPDYNFFREISRRRVECHTGDKSNCAVHPLGAAAASKDNEYLMGYLEKRTHRSQKWQKRWFVLSECRKVLYYFYGPESIKPCAAIPLEDVEVVELVNTPRTTQFGPGSACKVFRLKNSDPAKSILPHKKDGQPRTLTILAPNPESKQEWVTAIKKCCVKYSSMEEEDANIADDAEDLQRQDALRKDDEEVKRLQEMKIAKTVHDDEGDDGSCEEGDYEDHKDEVRSIASVHSSFQDTDSLSDGRTLHLVLPFVPGITSTKNPEEAYIKSLISSTKTYVNDIFTQLTHKIPKAVSFSIIDECKKRMEAKISENLCGKTEAELQGLIGKDPAVVEQVIGLKAELGHVKEQLDVILLACTPVAAST
ncbi:PH domain-containing protein [Chloropicon primus]|nr:PH domain-containing protein [Chloropicon primus]